jgi:predicted porin
VNQTNDESISTATGARADEIFIRESKVYLESTRLGRVSLGQQSSASDEITAINVARSVYVDSSSHQVFVGSFRLRDGDALTGFRFTNLMGSDSTNPPGDGARFDVIRYDSPSVAGFKVSASWGEDDLWDVALRYSGLLGGRFKTAAGVAYLARTDGDATETSFPGTTSSRNGCIFDTNKDVDCHMIGMSGSIMDMGTGLFMHGAYGINTDNNKPAGVDDEASFWYLHGGIEKKWLAYGATTVFAVYGEFDTGFERVTQSATAIGSFENGEATLWGLGVNQNFESAAIDLYLKYNHYTASADNVSQTRAATLEHVEFNDFDVIYGGARIAF